MSRTRRLLVLGATAAAASAVAARRRNARWRAAGDADGPQWSAFPAGEERSVVTSDGARLAVTVAGPENGSTVVLAHGWTNSRTVWAPVARRLIANGHRVVAYDQRGHAASTVGTEPFSTSRLGSDLRELLVALDIHDAVLTGHSMGGMTIMALVGDDPVAIKEHARALVLVSTAASGLARAGNLDAAVARLLASTPVSRMMRGPMGTRFTRGAFGAKPVYAHLHATREMWLATPGQVIGDAMLALASMDIRAGLESCPVPATVLVGTRDTLTRRALGEEIASLIPHATLQVFPGAGHMLPLERRNEVVDAIERAAAA